MEQLVILAMVRPHAVICEGHTYSQSLGQRRGTELPLEDSVWNAEGSGLVHAEL